MAVRVSSDDPSIRTFRAQIERSGATSRPQLVLPTEAADHFPVAAVQLVLAGSRYHADVRAGDAGPVVRGAYDNARLARSPGEGDNRLPDWLAGIGLDFGRSVLIDVVVPDFRYGARPPGTTAVYDAAEPPSTSLSRIADSLDE